MEMMSLFYVLYYLRTLHSDLFKRTMNILNFSLLSEAGFTSVRSAVKEIRALEDGYFFEQDIEVYDYPVSVQSDYVRYRHQVADSVLTATA